MSVVDKLTLQLPEPQRLLVKKVMEIGKPTVIVIVSGSSLNVEAEPNAILQAFYPGSEGGKAVSEILFGKISPSGKLPVTFYKDVHKLPDFTDYSMKYRTYRNERADDDNVLYPFGYGLSYGDIRVESASVDDLGDELKATVMLVNGGKSASDVLQCYFRSGSKDAVRNHALCGFKKVQLQSGEAKTVEMIIKKSALTVVDSEGRRYLDTAAPTALYFGTSQPDELSQKLTGKTCVKVDIKL